MSNGGAEPRVVLSDLDPPAPLHGDISSDKRRMFKYAVTKDDGYFSSTSTPKSSGQLSSGDAHPEKVPITDGSLSVSLPEVAVAEPSSLPPDVDKDRPQWSKKADFLLSIIGFAVDLANVWRFPYLCYRNGGGVFLIPYLILLVFGAMPLFYMELVLGQYNRVGPISIWKICPLFQGVGYCSVLVSWYVSFYYNVIIGWTFYFMFYSFKLSLPWIQCDNEWNTDKCWGEPYNFSYPKENRSSPVMEFFDREVLELHKSNGINDLGNPKWQLVLSIFIVFFILYFALFKGVKSSGKVVWFTATAPYIILTILLIRGLFLPGAAKGVAYYLRPELSKLLETQVWVDAAVQVFFSVGVGFGVHLTYASYNTFNNNCYKDCLLTSAVNSFTSLYSGFVIFTFLGYMSEKQGIPINEVATEGYALVFQVYPEAIATLPGGPFWAVLFFTMLLTLGLDSAMGGLESIVTGLMDEFRDTFARFHIKRELFTAIVICTSFLIAIVNVTRGGGYMMHWFDTYSAGISLLCAALFEAIGVAWIYGLGTFSDNIEEMMGFRPGIYWRICWKFVSPIFLIAVILSGIINSSPLKYQDYDYPSWAVGLGWSFALSSVAMVPIVMIYRIVFGKKGSCSENLAFAITPVMEHKEIEETGVVKRFKCEHWLQI